MKIGRCRIPVEDPSARGRVAASLGGSAVQFGDELFVYAADSKWSSLKREAGRLGVGLEEHPAKVPESNLHLVIQKGRLFEQEHPDVPVLLDKGRYLVVSMPATEAERVADLPTPCYTVRPLVDGEVVFETRPAAAERRAPEAWIQSLVNKVSQANLQARLQHLVSYTTRHSTSSYYANAANWAKAELAAMGYSASLASVSVSGSTSYNVIAEKQGSGTAPRKVVLVVAHLDSINQAGGPSAPAPGADDNGSGSAGLLELARVLKDHPGVHDLRLILFGGEEQGLFGSKQYVAGLSATEKARIRAVINMDMIGSLNTASPTVLVEGAAVSQSVITQLSTASSDYTNLAVQTSLNAWGSDHVSFLNQQVPAALTIEGADSANPNDHTANDTLAHINYNLMTEILRMNVACAASLLEQGGVIMATQFSGRYKINGGYEYRTGAREGAAENPSTIHNLSEPIYRDDLYMLDDSIYTVNNFNWNYGYWWYNWWLEWGKLRCTLHVDIDGTDPLNVVSGTVSQNLAVSAFKNPAQFIGRVTSNTPISGGRRIVVENFSIIWPDGDTVNKIEIDLTSPLGGVPTADVVFRTNTGQPKGPYSVQRDSPYFRDVEVEMDREDGAVDAEPYNTHTHPDRPSNLPKEDLTLISAFARSGVKITKSSGANTISSNVAGADKKWTYQELHDAMAAHWSAFKNQPQWKLWVFLAEHATSSTLGGVMFDGNINDPGGVDRQGTAIFTKCEHFHGPNGAYTKANPPAAAAAKRELFFDLIHETGHAFNLFHSFQKSYDTPWSAVSWLPVTQTSKALSWMNYPDVYSGGNAAKAFYDKFRFRFSDEENLFLRHAPARYVMMGAEDWGQNHARVMRGSLDPRLQFVVRGLKTIFELGEPVTLELKLKNIGEETVGVAAELDPADDFVELAITNPRGERLPFLSFFHAKKYVERTMLAPGESIYAPLRLVIGMEGSPFKEPGAYRVEASYTNLDGRTAAAVMQLYIRPPASFDHLPVINDLFNAEVGRVVTVGGTRTQEEVCEKLESVIEKLGPKHPARFRLLKTLSGGRAHNFKTIDLDKNTVELREADPDYVQQKLKPVVDHPGEASDSLGHIEFRELVETFTGMAVQAGKKAVARTAQKSLVDLFKKRQVIPAVVKKEEARLRKLK